MLEVTLDQSGKIEIPEPMRKLLGLTPGSKLQMATDWRQEIWLRLPPKDQPQDEDAIGENDHSAQIEEVRLVEKNGVLMAEAASMDESVSFYLEHAVEFDRETRIREFMGDGLWHELSPTITT